MSDVTVVISDLWVKNLKFVTGFVGFDKCWKCGVHMEFEEFYGFCNFVRLKLNCDGTVNIDIKYRLRSLYNK